MIKPFANEGSQPLADGARPYTGNFMGVATIEKLEGANPRAFRFYLGTG
jgi:hypothetical protein